MKIKNIIFLLLSLAFLCSCEPHVHFGPDYGNPDTDRGYVLTGRWFGDIGVVIDGEKAHGSVLDFRSDDYYYQYGYGLETDYYYDRIGRLCAIENSFEWEIRNRVIYMYFDNPDLDCRISNYRLSDTHFNGYLIDRYGEATPFNLRNYDRYWGDFGCGPVYVKSRSADSTSVASSEIQPKCIRRIQLTTIAR